MAIRERGKIKWQPASFIPLAFEMQRSMYQDQESRPMPLIDEYEAQEFDQRIDYAIDNNLAVWLTVWINGFTNDFIG